MLDETAVVQPYTPTRALPTGDLLEATGWQVNPEGRLELVAVSHNQPRQPLSPCSI